MAVADNDEAPVGCVLFVDDERAVLDVGQRFLTLSGFEVVTAGSATAALERFAERQADICVAVLDVSMPDMSGPELLRRMRERRPDIRALMTSGYPSSELEGLGGSAFLQKPYKLLQLVNAVKELCGKAAGDAK